MLLHQSIGPSNAAVFAVSEGSFYGFIMSVNSQAKIYCFLFLFTFNVPYKWNDDLPYGILCYDVLLWSAPHVHVYK